MLGLEAIDLARIQFAFTISFHIIFPAITIGLASYLAVLEGLWLKTQQEVYRDLYHFWSKIFAVNFGMGVVSGLVMAYQFGTNWSVFSDFAGSITGPLLTYEVLTAFFLEAGFLGVMLFGWNRVGPGLHFFSTVMVAIGTLISAFWILASNSWMQTPQGFEIIDGRVIPVDWFAVVFNPSFPYRLAHMATAAFVATAFFVGASAAWHLLRGRDNPAIRKMLSMAMWMALIVAPIQAVIGDFHGLNTLKHQPAKIAAIEGHWENVGDEPTPLILFGWPDMRREETRFAVEIPYLGSLILTHELDKQVPALKEFPPEDRPNSTIVFWSFRVMVGLGMLMVLTGIWSLWLRSRGTLYQSRPFLHLALWMGPSGLIAILAGWFTTEIGRQPWVVYGLMRTADASSGQSFAQVSLTLGLFVVVYFSLFGVGIGGREELNTMGIDLSLIWAIIIVFGIMMYVVMDGFDLGIGILFPFIKDAGERDVMMNTVAPVWDGNETWLVLGGAGLFAAFPMAYSVVLSALYLPIIFMLIGLIFRGVAFEFRFKARAHKQHIWDKSFIGGSLAATFFQGMALGAFIEGIPVLGRAYAGGPLDWLTPFSVFCGLALIAAYALLGCTWLIMKTEGRLQQQMHDLATPLVWALLAVTGVVSIWTPLAHEAIAQRWFSLPNLFWFLPVPLLVLVCTFALLRAVKNNAHYSPFVLTLALIFLGYSGLGISLWPNIIPPSVSIWEAAAPPQSQGFTLVGALFIIPFILMYTAWSYYVFRGKVSAENGYH